MAWRPAANPWAIAMVVALAAFMEVLDTSIANVALPYMAGSLSATSDHSTWILTSYLVSNAIVLPIWVDAYGRTYQGRVLNIAGASGARYSLLPPENATGNYVKVVQRITRQIVFDQGQGAEHLLRLGMSVEPNVRVR